jgi:hypothetical protein
MTAQAAVPLFSLLVILSLLSMWNGLFYGDDELGDLFGDIAEPDGFLGTLDFLSDLVVAIAKAFWIFLNVPGSEHLPETLQGPIHVVFAVVFVLVLLGTLASLIP